MAELLTPPMASTTSNLHIIGILNELKNLSNSNNNSETNRSEKCAAEPPSKQFRDFHFALIWLLFAAIIIGNTIVLAAVGLSKTKRRSRMTFFIFNLALADLLVGLISVLYENMSLTMGSRWYGGWFLCAYASYLSDVVTYSSSYVLVALSIDRLHAIARPMSFTSSGLRAKILVLVAWALAFLFSIPQPIYRTVQYDKYVGGEACLIIFPNTWYFRPYFSLVMVAAVFIPAVIIGACYTAIIYIIWTKSKTTGTKNAITARRSRSERTRGSTGDRETNGVSGTDCSSRGLIPKAKIRTVKMTLVIVLAFIFCWSPYSLYNLLSVYGAMPCFRHQYAVTQMIQSLAPLNSAANPLIYGIFSTRICQHLRILPFVDWLAKRLCCCCCPKHIHHPGISTMANTEYSTVPDSDVHMRTRRTSRDVVSYSSLVDKDEIMLHVMKPAYVDKDPR